MGAEGEAGNVENGVKIELKKSLPKKKKPKKNKKNKVPPGQLAHDILQSPGGPLPSMIYAGQEHDYQGRGMIPGYGMQ